MPFSFPLQTYYAAKRQLYQEALLQRYSCRSYAKPLSDKQQAGLALAAAQVCLPGVRIEMAPCPENLFFGLPLVGRIHGMSHCAYIFAAQDADHAAIRAGISGEAFVLEATALGVGTCWVSGSYRRSAITVTPRPKEKLMAVTPLGVPADEKNKSLGHHKALEKICTGNPAFWPDWALQAAKNVQSAPSAVNMQPWKLQYVPSTLTLTTPGKTDTLDQGIALLHMECALDCLTHHWTWGEGKTVAHLTIEENA